MMKDIKSRGMFIFHVEDFYKGLSILPLVDESILAAYKAIRVLAPNLSTFDFATSTGLQCGWRSASEYHREWELNFDWATGKGKGWIFFVKDPAGVKILEHSPLRERVRALGGWELFNDYQPRWAQLKPQVQLDWLEGTTCYYHPVPTTVKNHRVEQWYWLKNGNEDLIVAQSFNRLVSHFGETLTVPGVAIFEEPISFSEQCAYIEPESSDFTFPSWECQVAFSFHGLTLSGVGATTILASTCMIPYTVVSVDPSSPDQKAAQLLDALCDEATYNPARRLSRVG